MFKIVDGREYFYQWDLDRQITVEDSSITEVHFCNRTDDCSLVVDVTDGIANVPNIILTNSFDVRVFGYDGKATLHEKTFKVKPRTKPADYVYVETEARKFDELMAKAEEAVTYANEICEYVENNKLDFVDDGEGNVELKAINPEGGESADVDLSNYYTKEETDELIANIEIPEADKEVYSVTLENKTYQPNEQLVVTPELIEFANRKWNGEDVILCVDIDGTQNVASVKVSDTIAIFINNPLHVGPYGETPDNLAINHFFYFEMYKENENWIAKVYKDERGLLASKEYVDVAIEAIPEVDLSDYVTKDELPEVVRHESFLYKNER